MTRTALIVLILLCSLAPAGAARADDCAGRSLTRVFDPAGVGWVDLRAVGREGWEFMVTPEVGGPVVWKPLVGVSGEHAHLMVLIPKTRERFAVVEASADHHEDGRVRIYGKTGELVASFGLGDLMTQDERAKVGRSISHLRWLGHTKGATDPSRWQDHVELELVSGRVVEIMLGRPGLKPSVSPR